MKVAKVSAKNKAKAFEFAVRKARQFVSNYDKARWLIAELATEVCDLSHGGRKTESVFSIARFAREIEIDRKTLYEWMRVKRMVYDKLPVKVRGKAHAFQYSDFQEVCRQIEPETSTKEVRRRWDEQLRKNPELKKWTKYRSHLGAILYNAQRPLLLGEIPESELEEVISKCKLIATFMAKELELRTRGYGHQTTKRLNIKGEAAKRIEKSLGQTAR